jgi:hypothetical protein
MGLHGSGRDLLLVKVSCTLKGAGTELIGIVATSIEPER